MSILPVFEPAVLFACVWPFGHVGKRQRERCVDTSRLRPHRVVLFEVWPIRPRVHHASVSGAVHRTSANGAVHRTSANGAVHRTSANDGAQHASANRFQCAEYITPAPAVSYAAPAAAVTTRTAPVVDAKFSWSSTCVCSLRFDLLLLLPSLPAVPAPLPKLE